ALRALGADVDEARYEQRLAEALAAMRGPRARRAEPAEPAVVAVVCGERAVRAVLHRDVHTGRLVAERALDLDVPRTAELRCDRRAQRGLLAGTRAPYFVAQRASTLA